MKSGFPLLDNAVKIAIATGVVAAGALAVWLFHGKTNITVTNNRAQLDRAAQLDGSSLSPLTGLPCTDGPERPVAVMLASDIEARPLAGLSAADMVFEMPVTPNGVTRMMAVYQCGSNPTEIGSIRSARQDFIPLAQGLGAIFAHWGGEEGALQHLNNHVIDNVDALIYEGTIFYRKSSVPRPHNGFSTLELIRDQAKKLGYAGFARVPVYPHDTNPAHRTVGNSVNRIVIPWPFKGMNVEYRYESKTNTYARWRGDEPEKDAATGQQVRANVVIVMTTEASYIREYYMSVRTIGQGTATIYQNGIRVQGFWKKPSAGDMLTFSDANGTPIPLVPGPLWIEIDAPLPATPTP